MSKSENLLIHVDFGSAGNFGKYNLQTIKSLDPKIFHNQVSFVQNDFLYESKYIRKIFNKYLKYFPKKLGAIYKFFDLLICLIYIAFFAKFSKYKHKTLVCSLYAPFVHYLIFMKLLRIFKIKIAIIVHDIEKLEVDAPKLILVDRKKILNYADFFICHTKESEQYCESLNKEIVVYPFPELEFEINKIYGANSSKITFLLIGGLRKEKGYDLLIEAINQLNKKTLSKKFECIIAGKPLKNRKIEHSGCSNLKIVEDYLTDEMFMDYISQADYVVLPYYAGTNSGILYSAFSLETPVITSNLEMFTTNSIVKESNIFKRGNLEELCSILEKKIESFDQEYNDDLMHLRNIKNKYQANFKEKINHAFIKITS